MYNLLGVYSYFSFPSLSSCAPTACPPSFLQTRHLPAAVPRNAPWPTPARKVCPTPHDMMTICITVFGTTTCKLALLSRH